MSKRGLSKLSIILVVLIFIVLFIILFNFLRYYLDAQRVKKDIESKEINYYLPSDFAVIKVERGYWEAKIEGMRIFFSDNSGTKYYYETTNYPVVTETKEYVILKDELKPAVPGDWDFSKVNKISFAFIFPNGKISKEVYSIKITQDRKSNNFGENCSSVDNSKGGFDYVCN